jgi:Sulfotransferase family
MPKTLFFIGNKRSGTSLLVKLLNLHPDIFITPESDIIWILYQAQQGWPNEFRAYPWDGPVGMWRTLESAASVFESARTSVGGPVSVREMFELVQEHLRHVLDPDAQSKIPVWIGDKKPVQHCDPEIRPFIQRHFPDARYLHIVRNPNAVVASKQNAAKHFKSPPQYWQESPAAILKRWAIHEEWVLQARASQSITLLSLKFEEFCQQPVEQMRRVFDFLGLEMTGRIARRIAREVRRNPNKKYDSPVIPEIRSARQIIEFYRYAQKEA